MFTLWGSTAKKGGATQRLQIFPKMCSPLKPNENVPWMREPASQGRTHGGGGARLPPWDLKNTIFSGFLPLNYVICIFEVCFWSFLLSGRTEEACSVVNSLRKVDFSHLTGHYTWKKFRPPPWENPGCAPAASCQNHDDHYKRQLMVVLRPIRLHHSAKICHKMHIRTS